MACIVLFNVVEHDIDDQVYDIVIHMPPFLPDHVFKFLWSEVINGSNKFTSLRKYIFIAITVCVHVPTVDHT